MHTSPLFDSSTPAASSSVSHEVLPSSAPDSSKEQILKQYFGYQCFRPGQAEIIDAHLAGQDSLAIMPTGAGKSLCYQIPALIFEGITLVISPLIALMKDQVGALTQAGVEAAFINSSLGIKDLNAIMGDAAQGRYRILYVAPERLTNDRFQELVKTLNVSLVTIDEAHCVSQWGHDFRPSYRRICDFIDSLPIRPVVSAFTATATAEVKEDIVELLGLVDPFVLQTGFNRENLYFAVKKPKDKKQALLDFLSERRSTSGIVYCSTRNNVEEVCELLQEKGFSATRYHAGLKDIERKENQEEFVHDRTQIMVATNAFGMGIDKSNVSFVVHFNMPKNIESYYQEAGRAGRDGEPATCLILYSPQDVKTNEFLITRGEAGSAGLSSQQKQHVKEKDLELLKKMTWYCTTSDCLRGYILKYFGEKASVFCGHCSNCNTKFERIDVTLESQKIISCIMRMDQRGRSFGKAMVAKVLHGSTEKRIIEWGLDSLSTYGIMEETSLQRITHIIEYLLEKGIIKQSNSEFPTLQITEESRAVIRGTKTVSMDIPKEAKVTKVPRTVLVDTGEEHEALYKNLVKLRRALAEEANMPAYIVFTDAALKDMCKKLPRSEGEFLSVIGVGQKKLERYGEVFLGAIREYLDTSETNTN